MRYFTYLVMLSLIPLFPGCGQHTPRSVGQSGARPTSSDTGLPDTGGGTMNNPTGLPSSSETAPLASGRSPSATATGGKEPQGTPTSSSGVGSAGQASVPPGPGGA